MERRQRGVRRGLGRVRSRARVALAESAGADPGRERGEEEHQQHGRHAGDGGDVAAVPGARGGDCAGAHARDGSRDPGEGF